MTTEAKQAKGARGTDRSNGYEAAAAEFERRRNQSNIGVNTIREWSRKLPKGGSVLDLGCGTGAPIATMLDREGFEVYGIDASPSMVAAFRRQLPHAPVTCEAIERSRFFDRTFDGVIAIGVVFLLPWFLQGFLIEQIGAALRPGGRFLFTAPPEQCTWVDVLTGRLSRSLGTEPYEAALFEGKMKLVGAYQDAGANHYFEAISVAEPAGEA